jgi:hypothetical protein
MITSSKARGTRSHAIKDNKYKLNCFTFFVEFHFIMAKNKEEYAVSGTAEVKGMRNKIFI